MIDLATMLHRRLRHLVDEMGVDARLDRALTAYQQLHGALQWFQEHQYGALSFELRHYLSDGQRSAALVLDALNEWNQAQRRDGAQVLLALQRAGA
jgi:hypothetical protein